MKALASIRAKTLILTKEDMLNPKFEPQQWP
jgi:hypothetical protein